MPRGLMRRLRSQASRLTAARMLLRAFEVGVSQVTRAGKEMLVRLGRHDVPVPGPLASAITQLINDRRSHRGVGAPQQTTWLFPGHLPGRPQWSVRRLLASYIVVPTSKRGEVLSR